MKKHIVAATGIICLTIMGCLSIQFFPSDNILLAVIGGIVALGSYHTYAIKGQ